MCPPYTFPPTFPHTQALPCMFQIWSHCCIWMQPPTLSPMAWSDSFSTLAPEVLLLGGWHTHWGPTTTFQLPPATFHMHVHAHLHFQCRWENGSMHIPPMETSFSCQNRLQSSQVKNSS